jgi:hypothetical protein
LTAELLLWGDELPGMAVLSPQDESPISTASNINARFVFVMVFPQSAFVTDFQRLPLNGRFRNRPPCLANRWSRRHSQAAVYVQILGAISAAAVIKTRNRHSLFNAHSPLIVYQTYYTIKSKEWQRIFDLRLRQPCLNGKNMLC